MPKTKKQIDQRMQTFLTRAKSAGIVGGFYILYALLLIFADPIWFKPVAEWPQVSFILNMFNLLLLVPIIYFVAKEITNLCFPGHKAVFIYTACALFTLLFGSGIFLLLTRYQIIQWKTLPLDPFTLYLILCLAGIVFFTALSTLVWVIMSRHIIYVGRKTRFWYPLLIFIINTFFVGFFYTTIIHKWTTLMFLLIISVGCDVFAYIGGSWFGKHKMIPSISPKKTWEGVLFGAGIALALLCAVIGLFNIPGAERDYGALYSFLGNQCCDRGLDDDILLNLRGYYWAIYILVGLLIMFVSINGDLFFSFIKRRFNIKDFSNLIPGHGGMLDRLDALIFTFTFYFLITVIIQLIMGFVTKWSGGLEYLWDAPKNVFVF